MEFSEQQVDDVLIVRPAESTIDAGNCAVFKEEFRQIIVGHKKILLDVSAIEFLDSSALGAILSCLRKISSESGEMKVCCLSPSIRLFFELVRMNRIMDIHETRESAIKAFSSVVK